ncbi:MAG TPA: hypothetical protein VJ654_07440 [Noviherbaspirillum sp.]|nr:hypothetical protein [Noviherbaspirillum sp.]
MNSIEEAYSSIAANMKIAAGGESWHRLELHAYIFANMVRSEFMVSFADEVDETKYVKSIIGPCTFIRDHLLHTTGRRIWGLTFTLYPDNRFDIAYNYDKPADYDDSEDPISLAEVQKRLEDSGIQTTVEASLDTPEPRFLATALARLQTCTAENSQRWGLGTESSWHLDMNAGLLQLNFADGRELHFPVQVIGTYNRRDDTFLWGWDHPSVPEPLRRAAQHVRAYGAREGFDRFTTRTLSCSENDAWDFTAAAAQLDGVTGAYRGDAGGAWIYMTFNARVLQAR